MKKITVLLAEDLGGGAVAGVGVSAWGGAAGGEARQSQSSPPPVPARTFAYRAGSRSLASSAPQSRRSSLERAAGASAGGDSDSLILVGGDGRTQRPVVVEADVIVRSFKKELPPPPPAPEAAGGNWPRGRGTISGGAAAPPVAAVAPMGLEAAPAQGRGAAPAGRVVPVRRAAQGQYARGGSGSSEGWPR